MITVSNDEFVKAIFGEDHLWCHVTDFLKEIQESSKSGQQQTIEAFITGKIGLFKCDLMTSKDMSDTIRTENVFSENCIYCDVKYLTPVGIGKVLNTNGGVKLRARTTGIDIAVYAIRNQEKYMAMSGKERYNYYMMQMRTAKGEEPDIILITDNRQQKVV